MRIEALKRIYRRIYSLGGTWGDFRDDYLRPIRKGEPDRILDAGCGQGNLKTEFERFGIPIDYYGVDLAVGDPNWTFRVNAIADLQVLPFKSKSFDKIVSIEVLEHVEQPELAFSELSRVLSPGGSFFLAVPFVWHLHQEPHDHHRFTKYALQKMAERHGLEIVRLLPMGGYFSVLRYMFSNYSFIGSRKDMPSQYFVRALNVPMKYIDNWLVAPLVYLLDFLDTEKKLTLGYHVHFIKPGILTVRTTEAPFTCPRCRLDSESAMSQRSDFWTCSRCQSKYPVADGIPQLTL